MGDSKWNNSCFVWDSGGGKNPHIFEKHYNIFSQTNTYSANLSKKQSEMAILAGSALQKRDTQNDARPDSIQYPVGILASTMVAFKGEFDGKVDMLSSKGSSAGNILIEATPSTEKRSTSFHGSANGRVLENEVSARDGLVIGPVQILDNRGRVVALGSIVHGDVVHGRKLKPNERKIYVEQVYDQGAVVWDGPQGDDFCTLSQLPFPTWLIWSEDMMNHVRS